MAEVKLNEEQQKDFERLIELGQDPKDAQAIVTGTFTGETKKIDTTQSQEEIEKQLLADEGYNLELIKNANKEAEKSYNEILVDDVGIETKSGYVSKKNLYELEGIDTSKDNEIKGDIRFKLGFGLDTDDAKKRNIKNLLLKDLEAQYGADKVNEFKDKIDVKFKELKYKDRTNKGLIYKIPKELGGTGFYSAVDSPLLSKADISDAVADTGPIVASIIGGTFGSVAGPVGTVAGSAVSAGLSEYARLMYGYHKLGLQNDMYTAEEFQELAAAQAIKYGAIDAAATGTFLLAAKAIMPTILGKSQLSSSTIKEFIETKGKTDTGLFGRIEKTKNNMKKEFNLTDKEADEYFAVSVGKAILESDQLIKKTGTAKASILADEVATLKNKGSIKAIEDKILKKTTGLNQVDNATADSLIEGVENQVKGQAKFAINKANQDLLENSAQIAKLESSFVDDFATKYLDEFGVYLDDTYRNLQAKLTTLDDSIQTGILKNKEKIDFNLDETFKILDKEIRRFNLKGVLPSSTKKVPKGPLAKQENIQKAIDNNKLVKLRQLFDSAGFSQQGADLKTLFQGFKTLQKQGKLTLKDVYTLKNAVGLLEETSSGASQGALRNLKGSLNKNIAEFLTKTGDEKLAKDFAEQSLLLDLKKRSIFKNFSDEFGGGQTVQGLSKATDKSESLFRSLIDDSIEAREKSATFGQILKADNVVPTADQTKIKNALYRYYFDNVIEKEGVRKMSHNEFLKKFGKNYENILGKEEFTKLKSTTKVLDEYEKLNEFVLDQNAAVQKFLPGIKWDALDSAGPGQIVEHIITSSNKKNITGLINALPTKTVNDIRTIFLQRMMKDVSGDPFSGGRIYRALGGESVETLNGAKLNAFLNKNRSTILQLYDKNFFKTYREIGDVLEMLQTPPGGTGAAGAKSITDAANQAGLFIDIFAGPLNHKRLVLNRVARIFDSFKMNTDNLLLFTDYAKFIEAAKKNFLGGNYPRFMDKLPTAKREAVIDKVLKAIKLEDKAVGKFLSKEANLDNIVNRLNFGFIRGAGLRKTYTPNPLKNPLVYKEYGEDKFEEIQNEDPMQQNADVFFPVDATAKYAIQALKDVFGKGLSIAKKPFEAAEKVKEEEKRDFDKEEFEEKFGKGE